MARYPKHLKIPADKDKAGFYKVRIGATQVGEVEKNRGFNFTPFKKLIDNGVKPFTANTMRDVRDRLVEDISRDLYMEILENPEGLPIED